MSARRVTFEVERFEHVAASAGTVLLRVSGWWRAPGRERLSIPVLLVDDGRRIHRLPALPGPDDAAPLAAPDAPLWRAAFSAPAELLTAVRVAWALDAGPRGLADLPRPAAHRPGSERLPPAQPVAGEIGAPARWRELLATERRARAAAEATAAALRAELRELRERPAAEGSAGAEEGRGDRAEEDLDGQGCAGADELTRLRSAHADLEARLADERLLRSRAEEAAAELRLAARAEISRLRARAREARTGDGPDPHGGDGQRGSEARGGDGGRGSEARGADSADETPGRPG